MRYPGERAEKYDAFTKKKNKDLLDYFDLFA